MLHSKVTVDTTYSERIQIRFALRARMKKLHAWSLREADVGDIDNYWHQRLLMVAKAYKAFRQPDRRRFR